MVEQPKLVLELVVDVKVIRHSALRQQPRVRVAPYLARRSQRTGARHVLRRRWCKAQQVAQLIVLSGTQSVDSFIGDSVT